MSYLHASAPRVVSDHGRTGIAVIESSGSRQSSLPKKKYRDPLLEAAEAATHYVKPNIMFDPRVQRGSTAGKTAILAAHQTQDAFANTMPRQEAKPAQSASAAAAAGARARKAALLASGAIRPTLPTVSYIHNHITVVKKRVEVPVHLYLVEQKEETLVHHLAQQTDPMMKEAPTPAYIPRKTGIDIASQVDTNMVFAFDSDVQAILEVVVSKSLEQALMEVREEEEMREIDEHGQKLRAKFASEEAQAEEMVRQERAMFAAKEKMLAAARQQHKSVLEIRAKLAASYFSRSYLKHLTTHAMEDLSKAGFFNAKDSVAHQLEATYLPHVVTAVDLQLSKVTGARTLVSEIIAENMNKLTTEQAAFRKAKAEEEARALAEAKAARLAAEELARRQRKIQLFIHSDAVPADQNPIGPINFTGESTLMDIENKVYKWMEEHLGEPQHNDDGSVSGGVPQREHLHFLWDGVELDKQASTAVYDLGITANLATLTMQVVVPPPPPKEEKVKAEGDDSEEGEDDEDNSEQGEEEEEEEEEEEADENEV